jgi:hypothetical protein
MMTMGQIFVMADQTVMTRTIPLPFAPRLPKMQEWVLELYSPEAVGRM